MILQAQEVQGVSVMDVDRPGLYMAAYASELVCKDIMKELVDRWKDGLENFLIENLQREAINGYARGAVAARDLMDL